MARIDSERDTTELTGLFGIRNTMRPERQAYGAMADVLNMDSAGADALTLERRDGYALATAFTALSGAYATRDEQRAFVVDDGELRTMGADLTTAVLKTGLPAGEYHWAEADGLVFYTGAEAGWINGTTWLPLRVATPNAPMLTAVSGSLPAGQYQAAAALVHAESGVEGGAAPPVAIDLLDGQALRLDYPAPPAGYTLVLYVTTTDGNVLYRLADGLTGAGSVVFDGPLVELTRPLEAVQLSTDPMPNGCTVCEVHEGRLYVAQPQADDTTVLWRSQLGWYHLFNLARDFDIYPGRITGLASAEGGLVVATTKEVSVLQDGTRSRITWYGTPEGRPLVKTPYGVVYAWTNRGVVRFPEFQNLTEQKISVAPGGRCVATYVEKHGREQLLVCTDALGVASNPY